jgi:transcriptional regulator with XRE-family HTH domain
MLAHVRQDSNTLVANMATDDFTHWFQLRLRRKGWTASDFARESSVPRSTVGTWFRGERVPDPDSCDVIADVLHVDRDEVLALAGHRPPDIELAPDDPRRDLKALIDRVAWDEERVDTVRGMLGRWYDHDQNKKRKKGTP